MNSHKTQNKKGMADMMLILVIVVGLAVAVFLAMKPAIFNSQAFLRKSLPSGVPSGAPVQNGFPANDTTSQVPAINNKADLVNTLNEVDNTKLDEVSNMLFENDADVNQL